MTARIGRGLGGHRADFVVALFLLVLAAVAIGPGLLPGRTPLPLDVLALFAPWKGHQPPPANPLVGDAVLQFSSRLYMADALRNGHFPLWDPTVMAGHPHDGDTHAAPFNPLQLIPELFLSAQRAYALQLLLQLWLAGLGMFVWLRQLSVGRFAALVGAVTWMLAGYVQVFLSYPPFVGTPAWLPWVAAAWEHTTRTGRRASVAAGGLAAGLAILAGQLQFFLYLGLILAVYGLGRLWPLPPAERRRGLVAGAGIAMLGLAIGAVHLLPAFAVAQDTIRPAFSLGALRQTGVPLAQLVTAIAPWFLGDPRRGDYRGAQNASEMMLYIGLAPLLLALVAVWVRRDAVTRLFAVLALGVALVALGSPLAWPLAVTPWLQRFGLMRWLVAWPFLAAPLVALALDAAIVDRVATRRLGRAVAVLALVLAVGYVADVAATPTLVADVGVGWVALAVAQPLGPGSWFLMSPLWLLLLTVAVLVAWSRQPRQRIRQAVLLGLVCADCLALGYGYTPSASIAAAYPLTPPLDRLAVERRAEPFRVAVFQGDTIALGPAVAPSVGLDEIEGYSSSVRESYRRFLARFSTPADNGFLQANPNMVTLGGASPMLLRLLNVRYVLSGAPLRPDDHPLDVATACRAPHALDDGAPLSAELTPWADGLNRIDVAVSSGGPVALHVKDQPDATAHLAYVELPAGAGPLRSAYFEPLAHSAGRRLFVSVDRPTGAVGPAPAVCTDNGQLAVGYGATQSPFTPAFAANGLYVARVAEPFGRAWVVPSAVDASDQDAAMALLATGRVDPTRAVSVESPIGSEEVPSALTTTGSVMRPAKVADDGPNVRRVTLPDGATGWLVLSEAWAPGWRAEVDSRPAPVRRAFGGLQAVPLPAGGHTVVLRYQPTPVLIGALITLGGLVAAGLIALWPGRKRPASPEPSEE